MSARRVPGFEAEALFFSFDEAMLYMGLSRIGLARLLNRLGVESRARIPKRLLDWHLRRVELFYRAAIRRGSLVNGTHSEGSG